MEKHASTSDRVKYIHRQIDEMDGEQDESRMQQRQRMVQYLCIGLFERHGLELSEKDQDQIKKADEEAQSKYLNLVRILSTSNRSISENAADYGMRRTRQQHASHEG